MPCQLPLLLFLTALLFLPGINYPFIPEWDDAGFVLSERLVLNSANLSYWLNHDLQGVYTPLSIYSLMLDRALWGLSPWGFHLHNLILHLIAVGTFFFLLRHFRLSARLSFWLALFYAIHPQRVESVIWITERKDVLFGALAFLALLLFFRNFDRGRLSIAALILLLLSSLAKPQGLAVMPTMLLYALHCRRSFNPLRYPCWLLWYVAAGTAALLWIKYLSPIEIIDPLPRTLLVFCHNLSWYLRSTWLPGFPNPIHPNVYADFAAFAHIGAVALLLVGLFFLLRNHFRTRSGLILYDLFPAALAYLATLMPIIKIFRFNEVDYCDRYNYVASAYLLLGTGIIAQTLWRRHSPGLTPSSLRLWRQGLCVAAVIYAAILAAMTLQAIPDWQNSRRLFAAACAVERPNHRALVALGEAGLNAADPALTMQAGNLLRRYAVDCASYPLPEYLKYPLQAENTGLAMCAIAMTEQANYDMALPLLQELSKRHRDRQLLLFLPDYLYFRIYSSMGRCYLAHGKQAMAINAFENALSGTRPGTREYHSTRGTIDFYSKRFKQAEAEFAIALRFAPDDRQLLEFLRAAQDKQAACPEHAALPPKNSR